jgi:hypothetical protein
MQVIDLGAVRPLPVPSFLYIFSSEEHPKMRAQTFNFCTVCNMILEETLGLMCGFIIQAYVFLGLQPLARPPIQPIRLLHHHQAHAYPFPSRTYEHDERFHDPDIHNCSQAPTATVRRPSLPPPACPSFRGRCFARLPDPATATPHLSSAADPFERGLFLPLLVSDPSLFGWIVLRVRFERGAFDLL